MYKDGKDEPTDCWDPQTRLQIQDIFQEIDELGRQIPLHRPWLAPKAQEWDQMTVQDYLDQKQVTQGTREYLKIFLDSNFTSTPYEGSWFWFLWSVRQAGGTTHVHGAAQELKLKGGTQQISELLAERIGGAERVRLGQPVAYLEQLAEDREVMVRTVTGHEYRSRYVVMAIPPAVQQKIHYRPALPAMRNQLLQRTPMGTVVKCIHYYRRAFWRDHDLCGTFEIEGDTERFPVDATLDDTKPDGKYPAIVGFLTADKARLAMKWSKRKRARVIAESYALASGLDQFRDPIHYEEFNWSGDQYSGGCYSMICGPGFMTEFAPCLREPVGRVHFAGTETAIAYSGYMDGAVAAGERAAREVLRRLRNDDDEGQRRSESTW